MWPLPIATHQRLKVQEQRGLIASHKHECKINTFQFVNSFYINSSNDLYICTPINKGRGAGSGGGRELLTFELTLT